MGAVTDARLTAAVETLWVELRRYIEPIGEFTIGHSSFDDEQNAKAAIRRALSANDHIGASTERADLVVKLIETTARCVFAANQRPRVVELVQRLQDAPVLALTPVPPEAAAEVKRLVRQLRGRAGGDTLRTYTDRMAIDDRAAADLLDAVYTAAAGMLELATIAKERLLSFADEVNAGHAQGGGRELSRKITGAFSDFDAAVDKVRAPIPEGAAK